MPSSTADRKAPVLRAATAKIIRAHKEMGYVKEAFNEKRLKKLPGSIAIGHVRYPTRGTSKVNNSQPHIIQTLSGPIYSFASNGDVVNYNEMVKELEDNGVYLASTNDGEMIGRYIVYLHERERLSFPEAITRATQRIKGAFSALFMTRDELYVFRDPMGFRPMWLGITEGDDIVVASESCALDLMRCKSSREVEPGGANRFYTRWGTTTSLNPDRNC